VQPYDPNDDPKEELQDFLTLLSNVYQATGPVVFWCLAGGIAVGALGGGCVGAQLSGVATGGRIDFGFILAAVLVGGMAGLGCGALGAFAMRLIRGPRAKRKTGPSRPVAVPDQALHGSPYSIADLYHEMSGIVFWCMIGGTVVGGVAATYWVVEQERTAPLPAIWWKGYSEGAGPFYLIIPAAAIIGVICGLAFGAVIELMVDFFRGPEGKKQKAERRKRRREGRTLTRPDAQPSTGIQAALVKHGIGDETNIWRPDE
jgi:hypothetical protein